MKAAYHQQAECPQCGNRMEEAMDMLTNGDVMEFDCGCGARMRIECITVYEVQLCAQAVSTTHVPTS